MASTEHLIALDMGTTSTKGLLYAIDRGIVSTCTREYQTYFPSPGRAEQDPDEVLDAVIGVVRDLVAQGDVRPVTIKALVFGGILHSIIPIRGDGRPLNRALIWADVRGTEQCDRLRGRLDTRELLARTGCPLQPLYFLPRLRWFGEESPGIFESASRFISIKEYVLHRLYGEYLVDRSTASGTGLMNTHTLDWDDELLREAGIVRERLSPIVDTDYRLEKLRGGMARRMGLNPHTPGIAGASDGPLAHLGSIGFDPSRMSLTVGTSAALRRLIPEPAVLPGTEAWCYYMTEGAWLLGGVVHDAGNAIQWFAEHFLDGKGEGFFQLLDRARKTVPPGSEGLFFLPFMSGERSPFYNPSTSSAVIGMRFSHGKEHLVRALVEGIAYRIRSAYDAIDAARSPDLVVTGGILRSDSWLQITADLLGKRLLRAGVRFASAYGAVLVALRALGVIGSPQELQQYVKPGNAVEYDTEHHGLYEELLPLYDEYYTKLFT
jgi:gluconokinase